jgi:glycogen phosphorylase
VQALLELGYKLEDIYEEEQDAALGNGGLGRLAACFLDSMATLDLPAWGYGIRYNYGIFRQEIKDGYQVEVPDYWLTRGNPWEIERVDVVYPVRFYGHVTLTTDASGREYSVWDGGEIVQACAHDNPIPGYDTYNTINLRLWKAMPSREFDLASFNSGDYMRAIEERQRAESISSVLYPSDSTYSGKELRLKQQYFFVSATLRDIIRRFKKKPGHLWSLFAEKVSAPPFDPAACRLDPSFVRACYIVVRRTLSS